MEKSKKQLMFAHTILYEIYQKSKKTTATNDCSFYSVLNKKKEDKLKVIYQKVKNVLHSWERYCGIDNDVNVNDSEHEKQTIQDSVEANDCRGFFLLCPRNWSPCSRIASNNSGTIHLLESIDPNITTGHNFWPNC